MTGGMVPCAMMGGGAVVHVRSAVSYVVVMVACTQSKYAQGSDKRDNDFLVHGDKYDKVKN